MINPDSILMRLASDAEKLPGHLREKIEARNIYLCKERLWSYVFDNNIPSPVDFTIGTIFGPITANSVTEFKKKRKKLSFQ